LKPRLPSLTASSPVSNLIEESNKERQSNKEKHDVYVFHAVKKQYFAQFLRNSA